MCTDEEKAFILTWCTSQFKLTMSRGYYIIQVSEVLHWPETEMYDPDSKEGGFFSGYINTFLKLRKQAISFPKHVKGDGEKKLIH